MKRILSLLVPLCLAASLNAMASEGYVGADTSLLSGPDPQYPVIVELSAGSPVQIEGCIEGWTWCDVIAGGDRGWVPGTFLVEEFENRRVIVTDYGPRIRIPIVVFSLDTYWGEYYRQRPWYAQRVTWRERAIRPRSPVRPVNINVNIGIHTNAHPDNRPDGGDHQRGNRHDDGNHNVRPIRADNAATRTKTSTMVPTERTHAAPRPKSQPKAQPKAQDKPRQNDQGSQSNDRKDNADNH